MLGGHGDVRCTGGLVRETARIKVGLTDTHYRVEDRDSTHTLEDDGDLNANWGLHCKL